MRLSIILGFVSFTLAAFALTGCQSEEDKKKEQARINAEIQAKVENEVRRQVAAELQRQVPGEVRQGILDYVAEKQREADQQAAAAAAAKQQPPSPGAGQPVDAAKKAAGPADAAKKTTPAPVKKKHP